MREFARTPERVFAKVRECRYYLVQIAEFVRVLDTEKFLFSLSAFLSAFRTTAYRLYGVVEFRKGKFAKVSVKGLLHSTPSIEFLLSKGITETHGDGAVFFGGTEFPQRTPWAKACLPVGAWWRSLALAARIALADAQRECFAG